MRMEYRGSRATIPTEKKFHNALNQRCIRARRGFRMIAWKYVARQSKGNKTRDEVLAQLSPAQKAANTTAGTTPGLINGNGASMGNPLHPDLKKIIGSSERSPSPSLTFPKEDNERDTIST